MGVFHAESTEKEAENLINEFSEIGELEEVVEGILLLQECNVYEKLVVTGNPIDSSVDLKYAVKNNEYTDLQIFAAKYLTKFTIRLPVVPLINIKDFFVIYNFIGDLYSIRTGQKIYQEDLYKVEQGDIANRIILMLENFDSSEKTPKPTEEFFKRLSRVKWQDKRSKRLFNKFFDFYITLVFNKKWAVKGRNDGSSVSSFGIAEHAFIRLLSGCSAVLNCRDRINVSDVVRANKTYLKLIHTDISKLM